MVLSMSNTLGMDAGKTDQGYLGEIMVVMSQVSDSHVKMNP
jgi:hypothetical protein